MEKKFTYEQTKKALENAGFKLICHDPGQDADWCETTNSYIFERENIIGGVQQVTLQHIYKKGYAQIDHLCPADWGRRCLPELNKQRTAIKAYH